MGEIYESLFLEAERVRWRAADIPWHEIEPAGVSDALLDLVQEAALSELTTFSATRRFLQEFADDLELSQWMSVWFYEETKHPLVLLGWLRHLGRHVDERTLLRGRVSAPFMRSRFGTLVTNIVSELNASHNYLALHRHAPEPVLRLIARHLAADEARHAAGFFSFARRMLERSTRADLDRLDALAVLQMWFSTNERVAHPVNEFHLRLGAREELRELAEGLGLAAQAARERTLRMVGELLGLELETTEDIALCLARLRASSAQPEVVHAAT